MLSKTMTNLNKQVPWDGKLIKVNRNMRVAVITVRNVVTAR